MARITKIQPPKSIFIKQMPPFNFFDLKVIACCFLILMFLIKITNG